MKFTPEQQQAIITRNCDLLVAAAAGSGKTAVLVERIIQRITNPESPTDIDKLLIVTFTEAAASEMRQRIAAAISMLLSQDPSNEHLRRQSILITKASISTIHSFCLNVIKRNFHIVDMEPHFRVLDSTESEMLKSETIDQLFEDLYDDSNVELFQEVFQESTNKNFLNLVEIYGNRIKDEALQKLILEIHIFSSANPMPEKWITECVEMFNLNDKSIDQTEWVRVITEDIILKLNGAIQSINAMIKRLNKNGVPENYMEVLYSDRSILEHIVNVAQQNNFYGLYSQISGISYKRLPATKNIDPDDKKLISKFRDASIKDVIKKIQQGVFFKRPEVMEQELQHMYPIMKTLGDVVIYFTKKFADAKKSKYVADFNDLEHYALKILVDMDYLQNFSAINVDPENIRLTKEVIEMQDKYEEILTDEYQDSNMVQELILTAVSRKSRNIRNRFMVGDLKQSIYSFRLANPELFRHKYTTYSTDGSDQTKRIDLSKNFRSRKNILDGINFICKQIMTEQVGQVVYDDAAALHYGAEKIYPELLKESDAHIECITIDLEKDKENEEDIYGGESETQIEEFTKTELEARIVAEKINEILESSHVIDKGNNSYRPAQCKDIVILLRSISRSAEIYMKELKKYNIKAIANTNKGFFDSIEVITILSFLQIIDNPRQDIHLIAVLHSPVYGFSADELLEIRKFQYKGVFFDAIKSCIEGTENTILKDKLQKFILFLNEFRDRAVYTPVNEILWSLYEETNYYSYIGAYTNGDVRQSNLRELLRQAISYENTGFKGIFHFIRYIEKVASKSGASVTIKTELEDEDSVRIMSIHKSKGLEFPIVFVSGLGNKFNRQDSMKKLIMHQKYGFGPQYIDIDKRIRYNSIARYTINREIMRENLSEEIRILYVALTRAKEKLILTGCIPSFEKSLKKWLEFIDYEETTLPISYILKTSTLLDCIVPAILRHKSLNSLWDEDYFGYNRELYNDESSFKMMCIKKSSVSFLGENMIKDDAGATLDKVRQVPELFKEIAEQIDTKDPSYKNVKECLEWTYNSQLEMTSKISVSEIKRMYQKEMYSDSHDYMRNQQELSFATPEFLQETSESLTTLQTGTIFHTVIEHLDLHKHRTIEDIRNLLDTLQNKNILASHEVETVDCNQVIYFVNSDLAERIRRSPLVKKEVPFVIGLSPDELLNYESGTDSGNGLVLVHGIIDCFFEEDGEIVLIDYKTDRFIGNESVLIDRYRGQIEVYKKAIERSLNKSVKESLLYLFATQKIVSV